MIKAVIFDMYETLITHYKSPLYFGAEISADAGIDNDDFQKTWRPTDYDRTVGKISFEEIITRILKENNAYSDEKLKTIVEKRIQCKKGCFETMNESIVPLLEELKRKGYKIGLVSNCFSEEAVEIRKSILFPYFNAVCLSYEEGMRKPEIKIFNLCAERLGISTNECLFVGDGGSDELIASESAGMIPFQARWYIKDVPDLQFRIDESKDGGYSPFDVITFIESGDKDD